MAKLARVIRLDESDENVFAPAAEPGEWAISGGFAFSDITQDQLTGKTRQAFANGWLGLDSFGRATLVAVTPVTEPELAVLAKDLARHFVDRYGAPSVDAALPVAEEELRHMAELCDEQEPNTLIAIERTLEEVGVRERYRPLKPQDASLDAFAVHAGPPPGGG